MGRRQQRVEELLRRELAQMLLRGELRDPRLSPASAIGITGVEVSADLSVAHVYVDVLAESLRIEDVLEAFAGGAGVLRHKLGERLRLRRMPELRFVHDESIGRGARIEAILSELREQSVELGEQAGPGEQTVRERVSLDQVGAEVGPGPEGEPESTSERVGSGSSTDE